MGLAPDSAAMMALPAIGAPAPGGASRWKLVVGGPARQALVELAEADRKEVWRLLVGELVADPEGTGIELLGDLSRRHLVVVAGLRVIYRIDTTQHAVRLIDLHRREFLHLER